MHDLETSQANIYNTDQLDNGPYCCLTKLAASRNRADSGGNTRGYPTPHVACPESNQHRGERPPLREQSDAIHLPFVTDEKRLTGDETRKRGKHATIP